MAFARHGNQGNYNAGGFLTVGGINTTLFNGTINYIPTTNTLYWEIPLDNVYIGGTPVGISSTGAYIDT